jgi:hypothetical protein
MKRVLLLIVALAVAALASLAFTKWFVAAPIPSQEQSTATPIVISRQASDDGSVSYVTLRSGPEVYRVRVNPVGAPEIIDGVVRMYFTIQGSADGTEYSADLVVPASGFPIELFAANTDGTSDELLVDVPGLLSALVGKEEIELRIVLNPAELASAEEEAALAALRGAIAGTPPPSDTPFRPVGIGYPKE